MNSLERRLYIARTIHESPGGHALNLLILFRREGGYTITTPDVRSSVEHHVSSDLELVRDIADILYYARIVTRRKRHL